MSSNKNSPKIILDEIYPLPIPLPPPPITRKKKKPPIPPQYTIKSIDEKHNEIMSQFNVMDEMQIPEWKKKYQCLKKKILFYIPEWDGKTGLSIFALENHKLQEKVYAWKEKMDIIRDQIKEYENNKKKYIIDNADFIFKYFEDKKQISSITNKLPQKSSDKEEEQEEGSCRIIEEESKNRKLLNEFFNIQKRKKGGEKMSMEIGEDFAVGGGAVEKSSTTQKRKMHNYWKNVCDEIPNLQEYALSAEICTNCGKGEYIINEEEGTYNCHFCGHFILQYVNTPKHFNNEAPGEVTYTTYDRLIHFKEILSQFQAKETTKIPEEMVKNIANRIRKERIKDISEIDYDKMRDILRTLGYNHYFEHIQLINSIFGIEPPQMDKELYDTLCVLFMETRKPWALYCPPNRTNFFNYTYVLYQLCVLLGQYQYLPFIPMMKDPKKRLNMDVIWKQLCEHLDWEYIASPH